MTETFRRSLSLLFTRRFGTFWFATLLSNIGTWSQQIAEPWLLLSLGASPFLVGLDSFAQGAPVFLLILVGGAMADQLDRRWLILRFQTAQMLGPILIVILILTRTIEPWVVIGVSLLVGITDALSMPAYQSIVPSIVRHEQIGTGIALNSTQFNLSRVLGPALAGIVIGAVGLAGAFAINALSYVPFILVALWILPRGQTGEQGFDRARLVRGFREIAAQPNLRAALATSFATALFCAPLFTFTPVIVRDVVDAGTAFLSLSAAAFGAGGLIGAVGLLGVEPNADRRPIASWSALAHAAVVTAAALAPSRAGLPVLLFLAGSAMTVSNASVNTYVQTRVPATLRGETVSLFMMATRGGGALGALATGALVHIAGVQHALLLDGLLALCAQWAIGGFWRRLPERA